MKIAIYIFELVILKKNLFYINRSDFALVQGVNLNFYIFQFIEVNKYFLNSD